MQRRTTNTVHVGDIAIGSGHPIAVQSMLCVAPSDLAANIAQTLVLKEAGCDIVRLAIPTMDDIRLISAIKNEVDIPLVADIQFDYRLAIAAVKAGIDKVRINPGNIGGSDCVHAVVEACRDRHIPIRIGVNSGSLEKDILQKYGRPTAEALVESALRHIQLLEDEHFTDYLVAIKSSDTITTVEANRLLAQKVDCPLHLGVTEAGTERMGIIKSSAALGALLCEGGRCEVIPAYRVEAVDTTAAGDVFNAGLVVALSEGRNLTDAVRFGAKAAAISVTRMGAQASAPYRSETDAFYG